MENRNLLKLFGKDKDPFGIEVKDHVKQKFWNHL